MARPTVDGYTGEAGGSAGQATVRFTRLPFRERNGERRYCHGDFGSDLITALYGALPEPRRSLFRAARCRHCGAELREEPRTASFDLELPMRDLEPLQLRLEIPAITCAACGFVHHTGDRGVESDVSDAMIEAFNLVGLRP